MSLFLLTGRLTITINEAASALGIGRTLAYEAARTGQLPTLRIGRRVLVPVFALAELVARSAPESGR